MAAYIISNTDIKLGFDASFSIPKGLNILVNIAKSINGKDPEVGKIAVIQKITGMSLADSDTHDEEPDEVYINHDIFVCACAPIPDPETLN